MLDSNWRSPSSYKASLLTPATEIRSPVLVFPLVPDEPRGGKDRILLSPLGLQYMVLKLFAVY